MKRMDTRKRETKGIGIPTAAALIVVISLIATSSVVIVMDMADNVVDDEIMDPFFHMKAEPMHQDASIHETVKYTIWFETDIYLYSPIQLHVADMYDGVVSDIYPTTIYPGENATLELTAICEGDFFREITGTYQGLKDSVKVTLSVEGEKEVGDWSLSADPIEQTRYTDEIALYKISIEAGDDFDGKVQLKVLDAYDAVISYIYPTTIMPGETAVLALYGMCPGDFTRKIIGISGESENEVEVELHVMMKTYQP